MSPEQTGLRRLSDGISCSFPACVENIEVFVAALHEFLAEENLGRLAFDMELLAREALVNAVQHGSSADPGKIVHASLRRTSSALELAVRDQGPGWDWRSCPATAPEPACESGRGLSIIAKYSDVHAYDDQGNALTITKRLPPEENTMPLSSDGTLRLVMESRISAQDVSALRELIRARLREGVSQLELDFSRVESLDSMGIGLLVATHNTLAKGGGALSITHVRKDIHQLLTLMRLDKHFSISAAQEA